MKLAHASDWHGKIIRRSLPEADLYTITGDMMKNTEPPPRGIRWPNAIQEEPF